jgi:hypothetical protein
MVHRVRLLTAALVCVLGCAAEPEQIDGVDFLSPADAGLDARDPPLPAPVLGCTNAPNYWACVLPNRLPGVCVWGECREACAEEIDCADSDPCTETQCFWGYCRSDNHCG